MTPFRTISITFITVFALFFASCSSENQGEADIVSDRAPDFEVTTIDGGVISLEQSLADGKPVIIYFTASWCPACARNWPALSEVYPEFEGDVTFVSISIDPTDTEQVIRELSEERGFTFPSTEGKPHIMRDFGVSGQATTVGVNRDGMIAFKKPGEVISADGYRELFSSLLN